MQSWLQGDEAALELRGIPQRRFRFLPLCTVFRERHVQSRHGAINGIARAMLELDRVRKGSSLERGLD